MDWGKITLMSIDPSYNTPGIALWEGNRLVRAYLGDGGSWTDLVEQDPFRVPEIAIEYPQIYAGRTRNPNDIVKLAFAAGLVAGSNLPEKVTTYTPREWKGAVPKKVFAERIMACLTEQECGSINWSMNKKHNLDIIDGIGVGLFHLGRLP